MTWSFFFLLAFSSFSLSSWLYRWSHLFFFFFILNFIYPLTFISFGWMLLKNVLFLLSELQLFEKRSRLVWNYTLCTISIAKYIWKMSTTTRAKKKKTAVEVQREICLLHIGQFEIDHSVTFFFYIAIINIECE